jgi:tripartite-type tricarboxylate transporter receptor subunit TctC
MMMKYKTFRALFFCFVCLSSVAVAQTSPITLMVGFPAGGGTDTIARVLGEQLSLELGIPVIVENRVGAGGQVAAQALKAAPADGSVLFLSHDHTISILPLVNKAAGFLPAKDFVAVAGFASFANGIALSNDGLGASLPEFIQSVRQQRAGQATVGVAAPQSIPEFLVKAIAKQFKLDLVARPYQGSAPMVIDMLSNQMPAGVASVPDFIEYQNAGKLKVVAVMGSQRQAILPNTPTFAELGISGFEQLPFYGIFAPVGTPVTVVERYGQALKRVLGLPRVHQHLTELGLTVEFMTSAMLTQREHAYSQSWARIIAEHGFVKQ